MITTEATNKLQDPMIFEFAALVKSAIGEELRHLILFGSRARNQSRPDSDCDYIIVLNRRSQDLESKILDAAVEILDRYGILVSPQIYSTQEWELEQGLPLGINVAREGIRL